MTDEQFEHLKSAVNEETGDRLFLMDPPGLTPEEFLDLQAGNRIAAIKAYRNRCGCTLRTAKTVIDRKREAIHAIEAERDK